MRISLKPAGSIIHITLSTSDPPISVTFTQPHDRAATLISQILENEPSITQQLRNLFDVLT